MAESKKTYPKPKNTTLDIQIFNISQCFPSFQLHRTGNETYWIGQLKPSSNSIMYTVKIVYKPRKSPKIFVLEPEILKLSPHRYSDKSLCLYYPMDKDYSNKTSLISDTIIPWTSEWLFYYEKWLDSGIWWGDEAHHGKGEVTIIEKMEEFA